MTGEHDHNPQSPELSRKRAEPFGLALPHQHDGMTIEQIIALCARVAPENK